MIQDHQCYTIIKCDTLFTIQVYRNYKYIHQDYVFISNSWQSTNPTKRYSLLFLLPQKYNLDQMRTLLFLLKTPPFLTHLHHLYINISLTQQSKPCLTNLTNSMNILIGEQRQNNRDSFRDFHFQKTHHLKSTSSWPHLLLDQIKTN